MGKEQKAKASFAFLHLLLKISYEISHLGGRKRHPAVLCLFSSPSPPPTPRLLNAVIILDATTTK